MKVRNASKALRSYSVKDGEKVKTVYLQPGQEMEADFVETTSFKSALESGLLSVSEGAKEKVKEKAPVEPKTEEPKK